MMEDIPMQDRREFERFKVAKGVYAAFVPHSSKRGQIIDISEKGLAFNYLSGKKEHKKAPVHRDRITIFVSGNGFHLKDMPQHRCKLFL